nr:hypothetical protein BgiMline_030017 [Biomphalaria glabrata]
MIGSERIEKVIGSERIEKVIGSERIEKVIGSERIEKVIGLERNEKVIGSERIEKVIGSERIEKVIGSERIEKVIGSERIEKVIGSERIEKVIGLERNEKVIGSERIEKVIGSERIEKVIGSERIEKVIGSERIEKVIGSERIEKVIGSERIEKVVGSERIEKVIGSERIEKVVGSERIEKVIGSERIEKVIGSERLNLFGSGIYVSRVMSSKKKSDTEKRPGSADTMVLILKPRVEDYKLVSPQFPGTKNEQQAYRKNRVIQMQLNTYLNEVSLQEKRSASIFKTEKRRFLQKSTKPPSTPASVQMIERFKKLRQKKFPTTLRGAQEIQTTKRKKQLDLIAELQKHQKYLQDKVKRFALFPEDNQKPSASTQNRNGMIDNKFSSVNTTSTMSVSESKAQFPSIKRNCEDDTKQWKDLNLERPSLVLPNITSSQGKITNKKTVGTLLNKATNDLSHLVLKGSSCDTQSNDILEVKSKGKLHSADAGKFTSGSRPLVRPKTTSLHGNRYRKFTHSLDVSDLVENLK